MHVASCNVKGLGMTQGASTNQPTWVKQLCVCSCGNVGLILRLFRTLQVRAASNRCAGAGAPGLQSVLSDASGMMQGGFAAWDASHSHLEPNGVLCVAACTSLSGEITNVRGPESGGKIGGGIRESAVSEGQNCRMLGNSERFIYNGCNKARIDQESGVLSPTSLA